MKTLNRYKMLEKIFIIFLLSISFMKVVKLGGSSFNTALSDLLLPCIIAFLIIEAYKSSFNEVFYLWKWALLLLIWIVITSVHGILSESIFDAGIKSIFSEGIKTTISVLYFFIGYNCLKYIKFSSIKKIWIINTFMFVSIGLLWIYLVKIPFFESFLDARYKNYFMGTYTDANHAATFMGINSLILFNMALNEKNKVLKVLFILFGIISGAFIVLTVSRGGILGYLIAISLFTILNAKNISKYLIEIVTIIVTVIISAFYFSTKLTNNFLLSRLFRDVVNYQVGLNTRQSLSHSAFYMGLDHPIFGVGRGNFILNSKPYFDKLGYEYLSQIPHNTYAGLFAETGIIGLILFSIPVLVLLWFGLNHIMNKQMSIANKLSLLKIGLPVMAIISVQAYILNVENQRFLWFVIGVFLYGLKHIEFINFDSSLTKDGVQSSKKKIAFKILLFIVLMFFIYSTKDYTYVNNGPKAYTDSVVYKIPTSKYSKSKAIEVRYRILVRQKGFSQSGVEMNVIEKDVDGIPIIIKTIVYKPVDGTEILTVNKQRSDSEMYIEFNNINPELKSFSVGLISFKSDDQFMYLNRHYLFPFKNLVSTPLYRIANNREEIDVSNIKIGEDKKFTDYFIIDTIGFERKEDKNTLRIRVQALKDISRPTAFKIQGIPDDISVLSDAEMSVGYKELTPDSKNTFNNIYQHQVIFLSYEIPADENYKLAFSIHQVIDNRWEQIRDLDSGLFSLELGKTNQ